MRSPSCRGPSIVGFGTDELTYASGRTVDWMKVGFSPRKAALTLYLSCDIAQLADQLAPLGKVHDRKGLSLYQEVGRYRPSCPRQSDRGRAVHHRCLSARACL